MPTTFSYTATAGQRDLVRDVLARLDEHVSSADVAAQPDLLPAPAATVYEAAVLALDALVDAAPAPLLDEYAQIETAPAEDVHVTIAARRRFLRATCPNWLRPVDALTSEDDARARLSRVSPYGATRAVPIVIRTSAGSPPRAAWEARPASADVSFVYFPETAPEALWGRLRDALTWEAAARLATTLREGDAAAMRAEAATLLSQSV